MVKYIVEAIKVKGAKEGALRDIHKQMIGRKCGMPFAPEKGYSALLSFDRCDPESDELPLNVYTSIVYNITERTDGIILETMNTVYTLRKV